MEPSVAPFLLLKIMILFLIIDTNKSRYGGFYP